MTEPGEGTGQHGQQGAGAAGRGPDTTMSLHPVSGPEAVETPESGLSTADRSAIEAYQPRASSWRPSSRSSSARV